MPVWHHAIAVGGHIVIQSDRVAMGRPLYLRLPPANGELGPTRFLHEAEVSGVATIPSGYRGTFTVRAWPAGCVLTSQTGILAGATYRNCLGPVCSAAMRYR